MTNSFGTYIRGIVGDRSGRVLAELTPEWGPISWRLNDVGQASFRIAASDPKATVHNLRFGNRLYIDFDNGLPPWGGVIWTPQDFERGAMLQGMNGQVVAIFPAEGQHSGPLAR